MLNKIENGLEKKLTDLFETEAFKDTIKGIEDDASYKFKVVVTTEGVDRDGETIKADWIEAWNYLKNPVVLINHEYKIESIVWKTLKIYQNEQGQTIAEGIFAKTEKAELVRTLYNEGFIKTVSVGFIPKERASNDRAVITKWEMLEYSFVAVPANPEATSLDGKIYKKALAEGLIKEEKTIEVWNIIFNENANSDEKEGHYFIYKKEENGNVFWQKIELWEKEIYGAYNYTRFFKNKETDFVKIVWKANEEDIAWLQEIRNDFWIKTFKLLKKGDKVEIDLKQILDSITELKNEFSEMKTVLKTFTDDKVKGNSLEKSRKAGQELAKSLSAYLKEAKEA